MASELAGIAEVAEICRVSRRTAIKYTLRDDFPKPLDRIAAGPIWRRADVEHWAQTRLPLPSGLHPTVPPPPFRSVFLQNSGWVNTTQNAEITNVARILGLLGGGLVVHKVANGLKPELSELPMTQPEFDEWARRIAGANFERAGWAWVSADGLPGNARDQGRFHAQRALEFGCKGLWVNCEEPLDAHGDWSSWKVQAGVEYWAGLREVAPMLDVAISVTPTWGGAHDPPFQAGAVYAGQSYELENGATVEACVAHGLLYNWPVERQVAQVGVYLVAGQLVPAEKLAAERRAAGVRFTNVYTLEQAFGLPDSYWRTLVA